MSLPLVESYRTGLYEVKISRREGRTFYSPTLSQEVSAYIPAASSALRTLIEEEWVPPTKPGNLGDLIYQVGARVAPMLAGLAVSSPVALAEVVAYQFVGLPTMQPFFEDDLVDEMYLDSPHSTLYLDHRRYGRCDTFVFMSWKELTALQTHLEMFCGESPSLERPTVKGELQAGRLRLRIGIDTPPLALNGESVHIRKVGAKPFTLPQLVIDGTMGIEEAAFLGACLIGSVNITIIGPSGSGKTSLLNALDVAAPPEYRRIYIEDAVESLDLASYGFHQSKLRVPPIESEMDDGAKKSLEVLKSLHKTPDLLILGEIQSEGHSKAMFQALSSGIRGLQTYHASGPEQALRRWTQMQGVASVQLADLGVLVTLLRPDPLSSKRFVTRISQVNKETYEVEDIFCARPPFQVHSREMEMSSSKAARDVEAARGRGWFAEVYADCERRLRRAMELGATDVGGFLDVYWSMRGGEGNEGVA
jgi:type IV secretory pathway ATPase VirB11/archaellum biosynthesis ATPase